MHFELTDEQRAIQDTAQRFTAERITPYAAEWDRTCRFPGDVVAAAAALGFGGICVPEALGGSGLTRIDSALIMEAMAQGCPSTAAFVSIHNIVTGILAEHGDAALRARYLGDLIAGSAFGSYCLTEPEAGSDAASLTTRAVREGDNYVVTGSKAFISGAGVNALYLVFVRTGGPGAAGISCLMIEKDMPGVSFGQPERKLGWHSQPTAQVHFDGVRVPVANRVGAEGQGFKIAMAALDGGRINIAACSLGGAQRCLDEAVAYTKTRRQFGRAIADFQATQFTLADMASSLAAARLLVYQAAEKVWMGAADRIAFAAMAKRLATDTAMQVADRALQLHGGYGYLMDYPIERIYRDLRVHCILEGTNEVMRMITARHLLRDG